LVNYDDDTLNNIQLKAKKLRDDTEIDADTRLQLWKETVHVRRKSIRDRPTSEIIEEYPGYTDPVLVSLRVAGFLFTSNKFISLIDF
jgi:hypothetical protein